MSLLWRYLKHYKKTVFLAVFLAAVNQIFSLLDPQIFRYLIDRYATQIHSLSSAEFYRGVGVLLLLGVGAAFVSRVAKNFQDYFVNVITQKLGTRIYSDGVSHSFFLPFAVFEDQRSGELLQKLQKARTDAQALVQSLINVVFLSFVGMTFVIAYAFTVNWLVGLTYFLIIPTLGAATFLISKKIKSAQHKIILESASLAGSTTETLRNVELVKSLGLEQQEISRLDAVNEKILRLELEKVKLVRKLSFIQGTLINAMRSTLMLLMLTLVFQNAITLGQFFSLLFYSFAIFSPLGELGNVAAAYQEARASLARLDEILHKPIEPKPVNPKSITDINRIQFSRVSFAYASSERTAISEIDFEAAAGKTVAFVGPSGSGKTTLIKLLVGLYRPGAGKISYNGLDLRDLDLEKLRRKIGLVSQDTQLFAGTIRENLLFAMPDASDTECLAALRSASATSILHRGEGLDTRIGEGGLKLSGGEKQRLAIARALIREPNIIIFDEATSSLDSLTEEEITQTINALKTQRPSLITVLIAHRLSTVLRADRIYVMEKGKIVETGTHKNLLKDAGLYAALWREQIAEK